MRRLLAYLIGVVASYEWVHLLGPPLREFVKGKHFHEVLFELVTPNSPLNEDLSGYFFLLLTFGVIPFLVLIGRNVALYWTNATVPISVLETHLTLDLFDGLVRSRLMRRQLYHANRKDQTAYLAKSNVNSPTGTIVRDSIRIQSRIDDVIITERCEVFGSDRQIETVELYSKPLPTNWLATLLPDNLVRYFYRLEFGAFRNVIATRNAVIENLNEYNGEEAHLGLTSLRYPVTNVRVALRFPIELAPEIEDFNILLVKENSGRKLVPEQIIGRDTKTYQISLNSFFQCTLHIFWKNKKLVPHASEIATGS